MAERVKTRKLAFLLALIGSGLSALVRFPYRSTHLRGSGPMTLRVAFICILALVGGGDMLGIQAITERYSRDLVNAVLAPQHPVAKNSVVVLISDETLRSTRTMWPLPAARLAELIEAIQSRRPRALMLDIMFLDQRQRESEYAYLRQTLFEDYPTPVFMAAAQSEPKIIPALDPRRHSGGDKAHLVSVAASTPTQAPYQDESREPERTPDNPQAALAVYLETCGKGKWDACPEKPDPANYTRPQDVFWGSQPPSYSPDGEQDGPWHQRCDPSIPSHYVSRVWAMLTEGPDALRNTCAPIATIPAQDLLEDDPRIDALIAGRAVFLGVSLEGLSDRLHPPTSQPAAGVFIHAMMFENLMAWGPHYMGPTSFLWDIGTNTIQNTAIIAIHVALWLYLRAILRNGIIGMFPWLAVLARWCARLTRAVTVGSGRLFLRVASPLMCPTCRFKAFTRIVRLKWTFGTRVEHALLEINEPVAGFTFVILAAAILFPLVLIETMALHVTPTNWVAILTLLSIETPLMAQDRRRDGHKLANTTLKKG